MKKNPLFLILSIGLLFVFFAFFVFGIPSGSDRGDNQLIKTDSDDAAQALNWFDNKSDRKPTNTITTTDNDLSDDSVFSVINESSTIETYKIIYNDLVQEREKILVDRPATVQPVPFSDIQTSMSDKTFIEMNEYTYADGSIGLKEYSFGEASMIDYILQVNYKEERSSIFTHVTKHLTSETGSLLYLQNYLYNEASQKWQPMERVINLKTGKKTILQSKSGCSAIGGAYVISDNYVLTSGYRENGQQPNQSAVCVYDTDTGEQLYNMKIAQIRSGCGDRCLDDEFYLVENGDALGLTILRKTPVSEDVVISAYELGTNNAEHLSISISPNVVVDTGYQKEWLLGGDTSRIERFISVRE